MRTRLDEAERLRQQAQQTLDGNNTAGQRNVLGQFATPTALALEMVAVGKDYLPARTAVRFLDPAVGSGVFFYAAKKLFASRLKAGWGYEIDPAFAEAATRLWGAAGLDVRTEDFCTASPPKGNKEKATLVVCNPPYVRHHHLDSERKTRLRAEAASCGFAVSGLAGLYSYFMLLAHRWTAPGGVGVWIVPAEFLDVNYGVVLKDYLRRRVTLLRVHRFDPADVQFTDALVSSLVVVFRNEAPTIGHEVELTIGGKLSSPHSHTAVALTELDKGMKWGPLFSGRSGESSRHDTLRIGELFFVKRGLATGANDYFILPRDKANELRLPPQFLRPILPSPRAVPGTSIESNGDGFPKDIPELVLLDCPLTLEQAEKEFPPLGEYLAVGKSLGIPERYLPAHRRLWCTQEVRPPAPILCTYMGRQSGGRALRFIRNRSKATAPNVYLLLYPKPSLCALMETEVELLDFIFEGLTEVSSRLGECGRVYGGGLNKIEPSELATLEMPPSLIDRYPVLAKLNGNGSAT
jgi:adenine-specific DNA-methyltransferase